MFMTKLESCTTYINPKKCLGLFYPPSLSKLLAFRSSYWNTNSSFFAPSRPYGRYLPNSQGMDRITTHPFDQRHWEHCSGKHEGSTDVRLSPNPAMWRSTPRRTQLPKCKLRTTETGRSGSSWNPSTRKLRQGSCRGFEARLDSLGVAICCYHRAKLCKENDGPPEPPGAGYRLR